MHEIDYFSRNQQQITGKYDKKIIIGVFVKLKKKNLRILHRKKKRG
jgi:hypothetical protein